MTEINIGLGDFSQSYNSSVRYRTNSEGLLVPVPANTVTIDYVNGVPYLRLEPAAANILFGTPPVTQDLTLGVASYTLQVFGAGTATPSALTATITGEAAASTGTPNTFAVTAAGTVRITIATATVVWLCPGAIPSSYFAGAAAIGSDAITDGAFAVVTDDAGELSSGVLTVGNCYLISAQTDTNFTLLGAPDSNVGTYFNATATGAEGILDAGDKVFPVTFDNWVGTGCAPQATAGSLTGKAVRVSDGINYQAALTIGKVYRGSVVISGMTTGIVSFYVGAYTTQNFTTNGTHYLYGIALSNRAQFVMTGGFDGAIDDVAYVEHGTARLSEANTTTLAIPAAVTAALADTGTLVVDWMPAFSKAAGNAGTILSSSTVSGGLNLIYFQTAAGQLSSFDATTGITNNEAYVANTLTKIALKWPSSANKYQLGVDVAGTGIVWGAEGAFDGAFNIGANLILGYTLYGPMWIRGITFYTDEILTDEDINDIDFNLSQEISLDIDALIQKLGITGTTDIDALLQQNSLLTLLLDAIILKSPRYVFTAKSRSVSLVAKTRDLTFP